MSAARKTIDDLTLEEVSTGNRLIKADMSKAITEGTVERPDAVAVLAWLFARRENPEAKLAPFRQMTGREVIALLGWDDDDQADDDEEAADPTASASASS